MKHIFLATVLLSGFLSLQASAQKLEIAAQTENAISTRDVAFELAPVKSQVSLLAYQQITPDVVSPISKLSPVGKAEFLASLTFNDKGVTGFNYRVLENELTPTQIYSVLALFGAQHLTPRLRGARVDSEADHLLLSDTQAKMRRIGDDYSGYACTARATCTTSINSICMSSC
jgi:hypothetical protein